jgi:hypothetical protein
VRPWLRIALVVLLAFLAFGSWHGEVRLVKGWEGLAWLDGYPWAAVPVCLAIALAAWIGADQKTRRPAIRVLAFLLVSWGLLLLCFEIAKASLFALHSVGFLFYFPEMLKQGSLWDMLYELGLFLGVPLAVILTSVGLYWAIYLFLQRISQWTLLFLILGLILIMPASLATCHVLSAIDYRTDYFHAVKMGYPAFWAVVLVGAAVMLGRMITKEGK